MISQKVQVLTLKPEGYFGLLKPGFRIRFNFIRIRIHRVLITNADPDPRLEF